MFWIRISKFKRKLSAKSVKRKLGRGALVGSTGAPLLEGMPRENQNYSGTQAGQDFGKRKKGDKG